MEKIERILLIDDDEITNFLNYELIVSLQLAQQVEVMIDAKEALKFVEQYGPELVLLDLKMPIFDGFDFLESLRTLPNDKIRNTKVVVLTTSSNPKDTQRLQALGINRLINKPLTREKMLGLVA